MEGFVFNPPLSESTVAARLGQQIFSFGDLAALDIGGSSDSPRPAFAPVNRDSADGSRIYKRSIAFLAGAAAQRGNLGPLSVMETIGASFHIRLASAASNDSPESLTLSASKLQEHMAALVAEKIPIARRSVRIEEALTYFTATFGPVSSTAEWLKNHSETHVLCNTCDLGAARGGVYLAVAHGNPLAADTGVVSPEHFSVLVHDAPRAHLRLHYAVSGAAFGLAAPNKELLLCQAYNIRKAWAGKLDLGSVTHLNTHIIQGRVKQVVQLSEALHDNQVVTIAGSIAGSPGLPPQGGTPRLVLIAGPSSSGKTTFAKRLCVALETLGARPIVLSVDSYYKAWQEIDSRGISFVDWESLHALNLPLLNQHLSALLEGKEILMPEYDMKKSEPMSQEHWTKLQLPAGGLIIMEGIHCLNPELTPSVAKSDKYQIMISPLSAMTLDDTHMVSSSQVRMLRRMVRDYLFRGRSATSTLKQWPGIALGERTNIYPNQNNADVVMNSGIPYEVNILKVYAEPLLRSITPKQPEYAEAVRLLRMLSAIEPMPSGLVPPQSLLREFIGGSWFYEYGGLYKSA